MGLDNTTTTAGGADVSMTSLNNSGVFGFLRRGPSVVLERMEACDICHDVCEEHFRVAGYSHRVCSECIVRGRAPTTQDVAKLPRDEAVSHVVILSHEQLHEDQQGTLEALHRLQPKHIAVDYSDLLTLATDQDGVLKRVESLFLTKSARAATPASALLCDVLQPSVLPNITLFVAHSDFPAKLALPSLATLETLESVDLSWCLEVSDDTVILLRRLTGLRSLFLSRCETISDNGIISLFADETGNPTFQQLEILDISWCKNVTDSGVVAICNSSAAKGSLRCLDISGLHRLTQDAFVGSVAASLQKLETLNVAWCRGATDAAIEAFTADSQAARQLMSLDLSNCPGISDRLAVSLAKLPNLQLLDLSAHENLTDAVLLDVLNAGGLRQLTTLNVSGVSQLTSAVIGRVLECCTLLQHLDISWCPLVDDTAFAASNVHAPPPLQRLNVSWCKALSDEGLRRIAAIAGTTVQSLELFACDAITDDGLVAALAEMPQLALLNVSWSRGVTDVSLAALAASPALLTSLSIAGNAKITSAGLASLLHAKLENLEELDVSRCEGLSAIRATTSNSQLKKLNISFCKALEEAQLLEEITRGSPLFGANLQSLDLSGNRFVSDAVLRALAQSPCASSLRSLTLSRCNNISGDGVSAVREAMKALDELDTTCCKKLSTK